MLTHMHLNLKLDHHLIYSICICPNFDQFKSQKMMSEMSREQLEDMANVFRVKMKNSFQKAQYYEEKYRSLKQKHQSKIRKIRLFDDGVLSSV